MFLSDGVKFQQVNIIVFVGVFYICDEYFNYQRGFRFSVLKNRDLKEILMFICHIFVYITIKNEKETKYVLCMWAFSLIGDWTVCATQ